MARAVLGPWERFASRIGLVNLERMLQVFFLPPQFTLHPEIFLWLYHFISIYFISLILPVHVCVLLRVNLHFFIEKSVTYREEEEPMYKNANSANVNPQSTLNSLLI